VLSRSYVFLYVSRRVHNFLAYIDGPYKGVYYGCYSTCTAVLSASQFVRRRRVRGAHILATAPSITSPNSVLYMPKCNISTYIYDLAVNMRYFCMLMKDVEQTSSANYGGQTQLREAVRGNQVATSLIKIMTEGHYTTLDDNSIFKYSSLRNLNILFFQ